MVDRKKVREHNMSVTRSVAVDALVIFRGYLCRHHTNIQMDVWPFAGETELFAEQHCRISGYRRRHLQPDQ